MRNTLLFILLSLLLFSCEISSGSDEEQYKTKGKDIIDKLIDKEWSWSYKVTDSGNEYEKRETLFFKRDGAGYQKVINSKDNKTNIGYFHWTFVYPDYALIYADWGLYWQIVSLTQLRLTLKETYEDPYKVTGQSYSRTLNLSAKND